MDLESIAEQVFEQLSVTTPSESDTVETSSCYSDVSSGHSQDGRFPAKRISSNSNSSSHKPLLQQSGRLCLNFLDAVSGAPNRVYYKLYRGVLSWINPDLDVFICCEKVQCFNHEHEFTDEVHRKKRTVDIPDLAVVLFLQEEQSGNDDGPGKMSQVKEFFKHKPWRFHHSEYVGQGRIQACPQSNHDYYFVKNDLPLCSVRQIHCGEEHVRLVRFVTAVHWKDTIKLYSMLLSQEPDAMKQDFCVYTVEKFADVDLQLALKKLPKGIEPRRTKKTVLSFKVRDISYLVPLLPHACIRIADNRWRTYDLDRNEIHLEVEDHSPKPIRPPSHRSHARRTRPHSSSSNSSHHSSHHSSHASSHLSCSAFTPVNRNLKQVQETPNDRLSPRVFSNKPDVLSKVQCHQREVYSPLTVHDYEHHHTDSGFMEDRSDDSMEALQGAPTLPPKLSAAGRSHRVLSDVRDTTHHSSIPATGSLYSTSSEGRDNLTVASTPHPAASGDMLPVPYPHTSFHTSSVSSHHSCSSSDYCSDDKDGESNAQRIRDMLNNCDRLKNLCSSPSTVHSLPDSGEPLFHSSPKSNEETAETSNKNTQRSSTPYPDKGHHEEESDLLNDNTVDETIKQSECDTKTCSDFSNGECDLQGNQPSAPASKEEPQNPRPPPPSYREAVSLLKCQRQEAGRKSAALVDSMVKKVEANQLKSCLHTNSYAKRTPICDIDKRLPFALCSSNECLDSSADAPTEGEPTEDGNDENQRRGRRRPSSSGKRVRFNDQNENFVYEAEEFNDQLLNYLNTESSEDSEEEDDDVFTPRLDNKAEGRESQEQFQENYHDYYLKEEVKVPQNNVIEGNYTSVPDDSIDVGFYI